MAIERKSEKKYLIFVGKKGSKDGKNWGYRFQGKPDEKTSWSDPWVFARFLDGHYLLTRCYWPLPFSPPYVTSFGIMDAEDVDATDLRIYNEARHLAKELEIETIDLTHHSGLEAKSA